MLYLISFHSKFLFVFDGRAGWRGERTVDRNRGPVTTAPSPVRSRVERPCPGCGMKRPRTLAVGVVHRVRGEGTPSYYGRARGGRATPRSASRRSLRDVPTVLLELVAPTGVEGSMGGPRHDPPPPIPFVDRPGRYGVYRRSRVHQSPWILLRFTNGMGPNSPEDRRAFDSHRSLTRRNSRWSRRRRRRRFRATNVRPRQDGSPGGSPAAGPPITTLVL